MKEDIEWLDGRLGETLRENRRLRKRLNERTRLLYMLIDQMDCLCQDGEKCLMCYAKERLACKRRKRS